MFPNVAAIAAVMSTDVAPGDESPRVYLRLKYPFETPIEFHILMNKTKSREEKVAEGYVIVEAVADPVRVTVIVEIVGAAGLAPVGGVVDEMGGNRFRFERILANQL